MSQDGAQDVVKYVELPFTLDQYKDLVDKVLEKDVSSEEKLLELSDIISRTFSSNFGLLLYQKWVEEASNMTQLELLGDCFAQKIKVLHEIKEEDTQNVALFLLEYAEKAFIDQGPSAQWLNRCDKIMEYVHTAPNIKERPVFITQTTEFLLQMHKILEEKGENFRLMTFIWKNLTKLSNTHHELLIQVSSNSFNPSLMVKTLLNYFKSYLIQLAQALSSISFEPNVVQRIQSQIKVLRFLFRALQGQIICFLELVKDQMEDILSVMVTLGSVLLLAISKLKEPETKEGLYKEPAQFIKDVLTGITKIQEECTIKNMPETLEMIDQLSFSWTKQDKLHNSISSHIKGVVSFLQQEDKPHIFSMGLSLILVFSLQNSKTMRKKDQVFQKLDEIFKIYRSISVFSFLPSSKETSPLNSLVLYKDFMAELVEGFVVSILLPLNEEKNSSFSFQDMVFYIFQQTFCYGFDSDSGVVAQIKFCWQLWKEIFFHLNDKSSMELMEFFLTLALSDEEKYFPMKIRLEVMQLIGFLFEQVDSSIQTMLLETIVTCTLDYLYQEGPNHSFDLILGYKMDLLEAMCLGNRSFLNGYKNPKEKEMFVGKYLPICFECCGTILDLQDKKKKINNTNSIIRQTKEQDQTEMEGMFRILDGCLLVLYAILQDGSSESTQQEEQLSRMLVPMLVEVLDNLTMGTTSCNKNIFKNTSCKRVLQTSLSLLTKFHTTLKRNKKNQFVQVLQSLRTIAQCDRSNGVLIARFISSTLADVQVIQRDVQIVWQLLVELFQILFAACSRNRWCLLRSCVFEALYCLCATSNLILNRSSDQLKEILPNDEAKSDFLTFLSIYQAIEVGRVPSMKTSKDMILSQVNRILQQQERKYQILCYGKTTEDLGTKRPLESIEQGAFDLKKRKLLELHKLCERLLQPIEDQNHAQTLAQLSTSTLESAVKELQALASRMYQVRPAA